MTTMVNMLKISYKKCNIETEECGSIRQTRNPQRVCWGRSEDDDDDDGDDDEDGGDDDGDDDDDDNHDYDDDVYDNDDDDS